MAILTPASCSRDGVELSAAGTPCGVSGDKFLNPAGQTIVVFTNASGAPITVTLPIQAKLDGASVAPRTVSVPAASVEAYGPFQPGWYNDTDGYVQMTYSSVVDLYARVLRVTPATV